MRFIACYMKTKCKIYAMLCIKIKILSTEQFFGDLFLDDRDSFFLGRQTFGKAGYNICQIGYSVISFVEHVDIRPLSLKLMIKRDLTVF